MKSKRNFIKPDKLLHTHSKVAYSWCIQAHSGNLLQDTVSDSNITSFTVMSDEIISSVPLLFAQ